MSIRQTRTRRRRDINFESHITSILRQVQPDMGITLTTLKGLDILIRGLADTITHRAMELVRLSGANTITSRDIQSAVSSVLPGELAKHGNSEGTKAIMKFNASMTSGAGGPRRASRAVGSRAGLTFSVSRTKHLIKNLSFGARVGMGAPIYLAAVLEYIVAEILDLAGNRARDMKRVRIKRRFILLAIHGDYELHKLFKHSVIAGGVIPRVHQIFIDKHTTRRKGVESAAVTV